MVAVPAFSESDRERLIAESERAKRLELEQLDETIAAWQAEADRLTQLWHPGLPIPPTQLGEYEVRAEFARYMVEQLELHREHVAGVEPILPAGGAFRPVPDLVDSVSLCGGVAADVRPLRPSLAGSDPNVPPAGASRAPTLENGSQERGLADE